MAKPKLISVSITPKRAANSKRAPILSGETIRKRKGMKAKRRSIGNPSKFDRCVKKAKNAGRYSFRKSKKFMKSQGLKDEMELRRRKETKRVPKTMRGKASQKSNPKALWTAKRGQLSASVRKPLVGSYVVEIKHGSTIVETHKFPKFETAVGVARLRLMSNPTKITSTALIPGGSYIDTLADAGHRIYRGVSKSASGALKKVKGRKNPLGEAQKMFEQFHGMPSGEVLTYMEPVHYHANLWVVGVLVALDVALITGRKFCMAMSGFTERKDAKGAYWELDPKTPIEKIVQCSSTEDGKQLFFVGGDQEPPLKQLGFTERDFRDHMKLGTVETITYRTAKSFEGKELVDFEHPFGKEGSDGVKPDLVYFPRIKRIGFFGGRYFVAPPRRDLGASPGIAG